jgi:hypothetical protein
MISKEPLNPQHWKKFLRYLKYFLKVIFKKKLRERSEFNLAILTIKTMKI